MMVITPWHLLLSSASVEVAAAGVLAADVLTAGVLASGVLTAEVLAAGLLTAAAMASCSFSVLTCSCSFSTSHW